MHSPQQYMPVLFPRALTGERLLELSQLAGHALVGRQQALLPLTQLLTLGGLSSQRLNLTLQLCQPALQLFRSLHLQPSGRGALGQQGMVWGLLAIIKKLLTARSVYSKA